MMSESEFNPIMGLKNRYSEVNWGPALSEGGFYLIKFQNAIYLVEVILITKSSLRIRFVERIPPDIQHMSVGNKEVWLPKSPDIIEVLENITKDKLRILKINSLENS